MIPERSQRWRTLGVGALALGVRLAVVVWAAARIPPTADGVFYHRIADRISRGLGYTWAWADGSVTFAAHYPIGYPGALGALYAIAGPHPALAMLFNALVGAVAVLAVHALVLRAASPRAALVAAVLVAVHPSLVAYTPALMTEGVAATLVAVAAALVARARADSSTASRVGLGLTLGVATLVRPSSLVLAPLFGFASTSGRLRARLAGAVLTGAIAVAACAPWTLRNCVRFERCVLVSANGGWNLLIGTDEHAEGRWAPLDHPPPPCGDLADETAKDACLGRAAIARIAQRPVAWLALAPKKLAATFDVAGAAAWHLHEANAAAFSTQAMIALGAVETLFGRLVLLFGLAWAGRGGRGVASTVARCAAVVGAFAVFTPHGWVTAVALAVALSARSVGGTSDPVVDAAAAALGATIATHAVFFGSSRYALPVAPLLASVAALYFSRPAPAPSSAAFPLSGEASFDPPSPRL